MFPGGLDKPIERARLARVAYDDYRAKTLAAVKAAAMQAIDEFAAEGWQMAQIEARRDGDGYTVSVTYRRGEE